MANTPSIQAVVFDLDDTLYPEREYVRSGYRAVDHHLTCTAGRNEPFADWLWERFCSGQAAGAFDALNEQFGLCLSKDEIGGLVGVYRGHVPRITPFEGVWQLLTEMGARFKLGLLSDGFLPAQSNKLTALGLEGLFSEVIFTEQFGRDAWKPSPVGFELMAERLGVTHDACCYVGDNPAKDFVAPNRLGWRTIQLCWPDQIHAHKPPPPGGEARQTAHSLGDLRELLLG